MIETRFDRKRGCGWRKEGGLYLVAPPGGVACGRFPILLDVCPTCSGGIKRTRGFTWIEPGTLFADVDCLLLAPHLGGGLGPAYCKGCLPHPSTVGRAGLVWVGGVHYREPGDFLREAEDLGISRRIPHVPIDFKVGETWIFLGHRGAVRGLVCSLCDGTGTIGPPASSLVDECQNCNGTGLENRPGIFCMFKPTAIEYVTRGDESAEEIERLERRGIQPVKVVRIEEADDDLLSAQTLEEVQ